MLKKEAHELAGSVLTRLCDLWKKTNAGQPAPLVPTETISLA